MSVIGTSEFRPPLDVALGVYRTWPENAGKSAFDPKPTSQAFIVPISTARISAGGSMRRREFLGVLGGAATVAPLSVCAQQAMPVIGFINSAAPELFVDRLRGFRQGLKDTGYV